jgi:hypothetical protein
MLIYTSHDTPRFHYAAHCLLDPLWSDVVVTNDAAVFHAHQGPKIAYGDPLFSDAIHVPFIGGVVWYGAPQKHDVQFGTWRGIPTLYAGEGEIPFDVFAGVFFLLSRYEEYGPYQGDAMGRFPSTLSLTGDPLLLLHPLIDEWRMALMQTIQERWPVIESKKTTYLFYSSIDVDSAFAYVGKGFARSCAGMAKDLLKRDWSNLKSRISTLLKRNTDKYDTYGYIQSRLQRFHCAHIYFFQVSDLAEFDRNVRHTSKLLRSTIQKLSGDHPIGVHPGVGSNFKIHALVEEKNRLENILGTEVHCSRQHYLMLKFPATYRALIRAGIKEDFTMGYADAIGFRAGTSMPFYWYDLEQDCVTSLLVHPIAMMDTTLRKYMRLQPQEAMQEGRQLMDRIKAVNGQCLVVWHNETLSESDGWEGWRRVWEDQLEYGNR